MRRARQLDALDLHRTGKSTPMKDELKIELTAGQQELLLRGLRFVRSSVALEMKDYTPEVEQDRRQKYDEIQQLEAILNGQSTPTIPV